MDLTSPFTVYAPGLAGVPKEERYLSPGVVRRVVARGDANLTLRNVLRMLRANGAGWDAFLQDMRSIFDGIKIEIAFNEETDETIEVFFRLPGGPRLPVDAAGTSVLQVSQILAYISLFKPQVLILDEPDSHLHPDNQRAICDLVCRLASERDFQAIISTHSRHVFDSMKSRSSVVWLSKGKRIEEADLNTTAVLMDLGALDSVDYFADGQIRCVVATEDSNKEPLQALLWSNGFVESDTEVASYAGCSKLDSALVLGSFLHEKAPSVRLVVHRDRDYMSSQNADVLESRLQTAEIFPFLTDGNDIESSFLNLEHLCAGNPGVTLERMGELLSIATAETESRSVEAIVNQRTEEAFRVRNQGGGPPNHGAIAVQAQLDYAGNSSIYRRGKIVVGRLQSLLQQETGVRPRIFFASDYLLSDRLRAIANVIWPGN